MVHELSPMSERQQPVIGTYWMKGDSVVLLDHMGSDLRFGVVYVQIFDRDNAPYVGNGGASMYWPASDFKRITDPYLIAAAKLFDAQRQRERLKKEIERLELEAGKWSGVMEVLWRAKRATNEETNGGQQTDTAAAPRSEDEATAGGTGNHRA